jgi:hypothetical protein
MNWRGSVGMLKLLNFKYYLGVSLVRQKNTTEVLLKDKQIPGQDLNSDSQEKEAG